MTLNRRPLGLSATYGYPEEIALTDSIAVGLINLTGVGGVGINALGQSVTGLPQPVNSSDATPKSYVDGIAQGISAVPSVRALSSTNIANMTGAVTVDGVSLVAGNRVLLTGQTTASQNGVWVVQTGAWTRPTTAPDFLTGSSAAGRFAFVEGGSVWGKTGFLCNAIPGSDVVDTNALTFTQFSGLGEVTAGNGLIESGSNGNTIAVALAPNSGLQFTGAALDHLLTPTGSLQKSATGVGVLLADITLNTSASGLKVVGVPANFQIAGNTVDNNVTSTNLNTLNDGATSQADGLHTHLSVLRAQACAAVATNGSTACAVGDPVYWGPSGNVLGRGDASSTSNAVIIGVLGVATPANGTGVVYKRGIAPGVLSSAIPGGQVFLAVGGGYTQTIPTAAGATIIQIGAAVNATDLDVSIAYIGRRAAN
jgi:hypothetical protein